MRYLLIALAALTMSSASAEEARKFEPFYIGTPTHDRYISACLDVATAKRVLAEQQENGAMSAKMMFIATGVCFVMQADFVVLRQVDEVDMGTHKVRILEVGPVNNPEAQHLFVITESPLYEGITA